MNLSLFFEFQFVGHAKSIVALNHAHTHTHKKEFCSASGFHPLRSITSSSTNLGRREPWSRNNNTSTIYSRNRLIYTRQVTMAKSSRHRARKISNDMQAKTNVCILTPLCWRSSWKRDNHSKHQKGWSVGKVGKCLLHWTRQHIISDRYIN